MPKRFYKNGDFWMVVIIVAIITFFAVMVCYKSYRDVVKKRDAAPQVLEGYRPGKAGMTTTGKNADNVEFVKVFDKPRQYQGLGGKSGIRSVSSLRARSGRIPVKIPEYLLQIAGNSMPDLSKNGLAQLGGYAKKAPVFPDLWHGHGKLFFWERTLYRCLSIKAAFYVGCAWFSG